MPLGKLMDNKLLPTSVCGVIVFYCSLASARDFVRVEFVSLANNTLYQRRTFLKSCLIATSQQIGTHAKFKLSTTNSFGCALSDSQSVRHSLSNDRVIDIDWLICYTNYQCFTKYCFVGLVVASVTTEEEVTDRSVHIILIF